VKIDAVLAGINRLGVDTSPFIYFAEKHPKYRDRVREIFRITEINDVEIITSVVTLTEVLVKPLQSGDSVVENLYRVLLGDSDFVVITDIDKEIAERAALLRAKYNLKTPDALQMATALESNCGAFLTNDVGIKRVTEIRVLVLDELELDPTP